MPVNGNIIQVTARGAYLGIPWNSTHYYRCSASATDPLAINWLAEWANVRFRNWANCAVQSWNITGVDAINLSNTAEVGQYNDFVQGVISDTEGRTPSGVNAFFKLIRASTATRNGIRYMNGLAERDVTGNSLQPMSYSPATWVTWYTEVPTSPTMGTYDPVLVRKKSKKFPVMVHNPVRSALYRGLTVMNRRMK